MPVQSRNWIKMNQVNLHEFAIKTSFWNGTWHLWRKAVWEHRVPNDRPGSLVDPGLGWSYEGAKTAKPSSLWWYWPTSALVAFWPLRLGSLPRMTCSKHSWQDDFFSANTMSISLLNCQTVTTFVALTTPLQDPKGICNPSHALCMSLRFQTTKAIKNFHIWMFLVVPSSWHCRHPNGPPAKPSKDRARNVPAHQLPSKLTAAQANSLS